MMIKCALCNGEGKWPLSYDICPLCKGRGKIDDTGLTEETCAICRGRGSWPLTTDVCPVCGGSGRRPEEEQGNICIVAVQAGKPYTARQQLGVILENCAGDVKVADPYYGTGSLQSLALLTNADSVKFLTVTADSKEAKYIDKNIKHFTQENPKYEVRKYPGTDLHDRYVLTQDDLILLGHGIKDIGNKESYVVKIARSLAEDIFDSTHKTFDQKWQNAHRVV